MKKSAFAHKHEFDARGEKMRICADMNADVLSAEFRG